MKLILIAVPAALFSFMSSNVPTGARGTINAFRQERPSSAGDKATKRPEEQSPAGYRLYIAGNANSSSKPERAVEHYNAAIREGYDTVELRLKLGGALEQLKRPEEAFAHYRAAIRMGEEDARPHLFLAYALMRSGRFEEALVEFEAVKRLAAGEYKLGLFSDYIGKCLDSVGRFNDALKEYELSLRCKCNGEAEEGLIRRRIEELKNVIGREIK